MVNRFLSFGSSRSLGPSFAQFYLLFASLVTGVVQVPVLVGALGAEPYGAFVVLTAIPSTIALADLGLLSSSSTRMMMLVSAGNQEAAARLSRSVITFVGLITLIISAGAVGLVLVIPLDDHGLGSTNAKMIIVGYVFYAVFCVLSTSVEGVLRAEGKYVLGWSLIATVRVIEFAVAGTVVLVTNNLVSFVVALLVARVSGLACLVLTARRAVDWYVPAPSWPSRGVFRGLLAPTAGSLAMPIGNAVTAQGAVLAVNASLGPGAVATFAAVRTVINLARQFGNVVTNAYLPELTTNFQGCRMSLVRARFVWMVRIQVVGAIALIIGLTAFGGFVVRSLTGGSINPAAIFVFWMAVQVGFECVASAGSSILVTTNKHLRYAMTFLAVSVAIVFTARFLELSSVVSMAQLLAIQWCVLALLAVYLSKRLLAKAPSEFAGRVSVDSA